MISTVNVFGIQGAHPVLGCLVLILSLIQPIGALLRCGPQHHLRYLFNWTHFLNAVVIKSIAVAAISTGLDRIDSDDGWLLKVMGGFFAWEVLFIIILEVHDWVVKHRDDTADQMESALVKGDSCLIAVYLLGKPLLFGGTSGWNWRKMSSSRIFQSVSL
ncbi:putative ferric-chelate reductase 1 [Astatotilapia calliptera]|uniref:putative ferric-chelate reductase 1 n=1 Tax=Astatotilapia calliptera TaxID=8154 RepID=UPI000E400FCD|nr:putative ferric-chelate reductase 1 [Astatotilapia calliptera]